MKHQKYSARELANAIRILAADAVEHAASGHPGMPMGFADVMAILARDFLQFYPNDPKWVLRDRLILSAGHGSMLLYAFYYLAGFKDFTLDDLKQFRSKGSITPGHPERGIYEAIEITTGPLGQGLGNSVGMAIAQKKRAIENPELQYKVVTICGDGCLMEGIGYEAMSLGGHLQLDNLIWLYDDNQITIDGSTRLTFSEDIVQRAKAMGWEAERADGHDYTQVHESLSRAYNAKKPYLIAFRTKIGHGAPSKEGSEASHGAPLGTAEVQGFRNTTGISQQPFHITPDLLEEWRTIGKKCEERYHKTAHLKLDAGKLLDEGFWDKIKARLNTKPEPTRKSSGSVIAELAAQNIAYIFGSADLSGSNNIKSPASKIIAPNDFGGNFIHYGPREAVMGAIMNGLTAEGYRTAGGTFLVFSDYMRPAMRLAALMHLPVIYVMTHDSIGVGEDGPTHQPIEHLASLRAMPNMLVMRPADYQETIECWELAHARQDGPSLLALTRQDVPQIRARSKENLSSKGAYIITSDGTEVDVVIFASGSELAVAMDSKTLLNNYGYKVRVISAPCLELYRAQTEEYQKSLILGSKIVAAIEAANIFSWRDIISSADMFFGVNEFGISAKATDIFRHFGLNAKDVSDKILSKLQQGR